MLQEASIPSSTHFRNARTCLCEIKFCGVPEAKQQNCEGHICKIMAGIHSTATSKMVWPREQHLPPKIACHLPSPLRASKDLCLSKSTQKIHARQASRSSRRLPRRLVVKCRIHFILNRPLQDLTTTATADVRMWIFCRPRQQEKVTANRMSIHFSAASTAKC